MTPPPSAHPRDTPGRIVVLGAGPTGLGAALHLGTRGYADVVALDAATGPGGLAASVRDAAGFTWDLGGHVHFSHYERYVARLVDLSRLRFGARVVGIDPVGRTVALATGEQVPYDTLISTLPLDALIAMTSTLPPPVHEAASRLVANAVELVGIGVQGAPSDAMRRRTWMYFPEAASPYYRVTVLSNYSPANAPDAHCHSLLTESSHPRGTGIDVDRLVHDTQRALIDDGLMDRDAPSRPVWHQTLPRGYPVPTLGRDAALATIHAALEPLGIYSRGRFGGWKYEVSNQDHSFMQGWKLVARLLDGHDEVTYPYPSIANTGYAAAAEARDTLPKAVQ